MLGTGKLKGTEQGENIQFNFQTAPAQSTNTKGFITGRSLLKAVVNSPDFERDKRGKLRAGMENGEKEGLGRK